MDLIERNLSRAGRCRPSSRSRASATSGGTRGTAALLSAVAVLGFARIAAGLSDGRVRAVVGLASAVTLWVSAYHVAVRG